MHDRTTTIEQKDQGGAMSKGANFLLCRGGSLVSLSLSSLSSFSPGAFPSDIEWRRRMDKKGGGGGGPPLFTSWPRDNGTCQPRRRRRRRRRREDRPRNRRGGGVGLDRGAPLPSPAPFRLLGPFVPRNSTEQKEKFAKCVKLSITFFFSGVATRRIQMKRCLFQHSLAFSLLALPFLGLRQCDPPWST